MVLGVLGLQALVMLGLVPRSSGLPRGGFTGLWATLGVRAVPCLEWSVGGGAKETGMEACEGGLDGGTGLLWLLAKDELPHVRGLPLNYYAGTHCMTIVDLVIALCAWASWVLRAERRQRGLCVHRGLMLAGVWLLSGDFPAGGIQHAWVRWRSRV